MSSNERNKKQSAYQIKGAESKEALEENDNLLWDSGKIVSDQNSQIRYAGTPLESRQECYIRIRVLEEDDVASDWSEIAYRTMGVPGKEDWKAQWIGFKTSDNDPKDT